MSRLSHAWRRCLGRVFGSVRLNRVTMEDGATGPVVRKRRRRIAALVIAPGNLFQRVIGADSVVLPNSAWLRREAEVAGVPLDTIELRVPRLPGETLRDVLADHRRTFAEQRRAFRLALNALLELHQRSSHTLFGGERFSHGDATAGNVCVDVDGDSAVWFDLDMAHRRTVAEADRQADDLRALVFSSATELSAERSALLADEFAAGCIPPRVRHALDRLLRTVWRAPNVFQLAQAPLPFDRYHKLRRELIAVLENIDGGHRENPAFGRNGGHGQ